MAVNGAKIRLGAPDSMILFGNIDLGGSQGGAELDYNPTVFQVEIDQSILPVKAFKTKEEASFTVGLVQIQATLVAVSFGYSSVTQVNTVAAGTLGVQAAPAVANIGVAGAASYGYAIVAFTSAGDGIPSATTTTATGNAALNLNNLNRITWTLNPGAAGYKIYRISGGTTQGIIGTVGANVQTFDDTGLIALTYTPSGSQPATPNVDTMNFGGTVAIAQGALDFAVAKNDGTVNHWRGHFNIVYSAKAIKIDAKRDKNTELAKCSFMALADLTQPAGSQAGYFKEEY